jgi:hypothetical protein
MAVYFFHCTDGYDFVLDERGRATRSRRDLELSAFSVASALMRIAPGSIRWSDWTVSVYDRKGGQVAVIPFPAGQA